jgi:hypothetical protein
MKFCKHSRFHILGLEIGVNLVILLFSVIQKVDFRLHN